ncbi:hypothetical protein [Qipengyuania sp. JC766]|uniref:hypothetical protein n=1 Tax=Qipengyuania sp. JC766 TaxID=3232139 RepID=UPI00345A282B
MVRAGQFPLVHFAQHAADDHGHGHDTCKARTPECWRCGLVDLCNFRKRVPEKPKGR